MIHLEIKNIEKIVGSLKMTSRRVSKAAEDATVGLAQEVMSEAQRRVPVVTGRLRSSAFVRTVRRNQHRTDMKLGYEAPYAIFVHEIQYDGHTTKGKVGAQRNGEGYKWLEKAAKSVYPSAMSRAMAKIRAAIRGK